MDTTTALAVASLVLGGGVGVALLKYLFAHDRKHQEIEDRLAFGEDGFRRNDSDHATLKADLDVVKTDSQEIKIRLAEIARDVSHLRNGWKNPE